MSSLIEADADSALLHVERRKGLWVFSKGGEVRWVDAQNGRGAFVVRTKDRGAVLVAGTGAVRLDPGAEDVRFTDLDRAAFSADGAWLALRWKTDRPREALIGIWDVARGVEVSRFSVERTEGALGWCAPGTIDLAVDPRGNVISAVAPSVYGFFARDGTPFQEICVLPEGEWIARTRTAWAHSPHAFRWGALRVRGRVLDQSAASAALGPANPELLREALLSEPSNTRQHPSGWVPD